MLSSGEKILMALATAEFILGVLVNVFIVLVNCIDWVKRKKLPSSDIILVSLAISRMGLSSTIIWNVYLINTSITISSNIRIIDIFLVLTHYSNVWFATILHIFYFLKITTFSNPLFLWMKWRIDKMLFMLLWGPLIISLSIGFPMIERMYYYFGSPISRGKELNVSQEVQESKKMFLICQVIFGLLTFIPFTLSTISFSLLILSLGRHTHQMQLNATGSRNPSTEAHVRAMKAMFSFLILFSLYYVAFYANYVTKEKKKLISRLSMSIMLIYPFGHSVILILWNSKLRKTALRVSVLIRAAKEEVICKLYGHL